MLDTIEQDFKLVVEKELEDIYAHNCRHDKYEKIGKIEIIVTPKENIYRISWFSDVEFLDIYDDEYFTSLKEVIQRKKIVTTKYSEAKFPCNHKKCCKE